MPNRKNQSRLKKQLVDWWGQPHQLHHHNPNRYPYILESQVAHEEIGRYHIIFAFPQQQLCLAKADKLFLDEQILPSQDFLSQMDRLWQQQARTVTWAESSLPFSGGWFLYLSYELVGQIETKLSLPQTTSGMPLAMAVRIPAAIIMDNQEKKTWLVAEEPHYLEAMQADLDVIRNVAEPPRTCPMQLHEEDPNQYLNAVDKIQHYIREGDVFQVNISRQWTLESQQELDPIQIYKLLKQHNPAPFSALVKFPKQYLLSCSPERLIQVRQHKVETRPIAGTRPRHHDVMQDQRLKTNLRLNQKERAEHIMLIDLERNDLGRVCQWGSVQVSDLMRIESFATVHHIVSTVEGQLRPNTTPGNVLRAVFPGGTITGCPKVRCMEIIAELEKQARGVYTGSAGYLNHDGSMDLNILIRSVELLDKQIRFRTGGGIVFDSVAEKELAETRHKAKGILQAFGVEHD